MGLPAKKILLLTVIIIMMAPLYFQSSGAATQSGDIAASVTVPSVFNLTLNVYSVDFGSVRYGDWKEVPSTGYANRAVCKSNTGNAWYLSIKADGPLSSGTETIPLANFKWMSTYAGNAASPYQDLTSGLRHKPADGYIAFTVSDELVYSSGTGIPNDNSNLPEGTEVQFKYSLQVPDNPAPLAGSYTTIVRYTMTE